MLPYCEHRSQSLSQPGITYNALQALEDTLVISPGDRQSVLDALVCFYSFENNKPKNKGPRMKAWQDAIATQEQWRPEYWAKCRSKSD